jgi:hypothetical protein
MSDRVKNRDKFRPGLALALGLATLTFYEGAFGP